MSARGGEHDRGFVRVAAKLIEQLKLREFQTTFGANLSAANGALEWRPGSDRHLAALEQMASEATDDASCHAFMRLATCEALDNPYPLPMCIKKFIKTSLYRVPPREKAKDKNFHRDFNIILLLYFAAVELSLPITKGDNDHGQGSCCDLVVQAMQVTGWTVSYDVVKKVWVDRRKTGLQHKFFTICDAMAMRNILTEKQIQFHEEICSLRDQLERNYEAKRLSRLK